MLQLKEKMKKGGEDHVQERRSKSIKAISLFLGGKAQQLQQLLKEISKSDMQLKVGITQNARGSKATESRFQYQLNFDQEQDIQKKNKKKPKPLVQANRKFQYCQICPDNQQVHLLSASNYVFLATPKLKTFRRYHHYIIAPVDHIQTRIGADQNIVEQIKNYQKCLIQMMDKIGVHAIFIEQFFSNNSHFYIQCIGIPLKRAYDLPFFFKQALQNVEGFWTTHKKVIEIRKQKGGIQKQIPKQMKYFYIDFGLGYGYAHVIEDEKFWKKQFCYQIVAAAVGIESYEVKTTQEYVDSELDAKDKQFNKIWKDFDWTVLLKSEQNQIK